ncbi:MAG: Serine/threonine-protein kinase pkn6 [Lentisphaerae bacterium ADurb.BinA184]|nr:MAG: Serine/threonine-protein kinase pkn6 [Lentisphaerae bacterium ADurb.BinA184]
MSIFSEELRALIARHEEALRKPGTILFSQSRYEIDRVLGEGGMGITLLAYEVSAANLKRPVVLKFVKDSLNPARLDSFLNEVQLSTLFNHPNLLPIYRLESEVVKIESRKLRSLHRRDYEHTVYFAVMQYIDGWNLRKIVDRLRSLNLLLHFDVSMYLIARIARGLHYVHSYRAENGEHLGLVHRDVSPENILIDRFGRVKVADFGIATTWKSLKAEAALNPGKILYSSPEQLAGAQLDHRSDIYNIGLLMFFLFTDNDRFGPEWGLPQAQERIRTKMKKSAASDLQGIDPRLARMCESCLQEDPDYRYQSCEDLATDIDIYFKETGRIVTNETVEEILEELFKDRPTFTSRRFVALTGSPHLEQPEYHPNSQAEPQTVVGPLPTVRLDET